MGPVLVFGGVVLTVCGGIVWYLEKKQAPSDVYTVFLNSLTVAPASPEPANTPPVASPAQAPQQLVASGSAQAPPLSKSDGAGRVGFNLNPTVESAPADNGTKPSETTEQVLNKPKVANLDTVNPPTTPPPSELTLGNLSNEQLKAKVAELCSRLREFDQGYRQKIDPLRRTHANDRTIFQLQRQRDDEFKSKFFGEANALFRALLVASKQATIPLDTPRALRIGTGGEPLGPALTSAMYLERLARRPALNSR